MLVIPFVRRSFLPFYFIIVVVVKLYLTQSIIKNSSIGLIVEYSHTIIIGVGFDLGC